MSMQHKGFAFDWLNFKRELQPVLVKSLETGDVQELLNFIGRNREQLTDPYSGVCLNEKWQAMLSNRDAHEYGDYVLTKYYDVTEERGVGNVWTELSYSLPADAKFAMLGKAVGSRQCYVFPRRQSVIISIVSRNHQPPW